MGGEDRQSQSERKDDDASRSERLGLLPTPASRQLAHDTIPYMIDDTMNKTHYSLPVLSVSGRYPTTLEYLAALETSTLRGKEARDRYL